MLVRIVYIEIQCCLWYWRHSCMRVILLIAIHLLIHLHVCRTRVFKLNYLSHCLKSVTQTTLDRWALQMLSSLQALREKFDCYPLICGLGDRSRKKWSHFSQFVAWTWEDLRLVFRSLYSWHCDFKRLLFLLVYEGAFFFFFLLDRYTVLCYFEKAMEALETEVKCGFL